MLIEWLGLMSVKMHCINNEALHKLLFLVGVGSR